MRIRISPLLPTLLLVVISLFTFTLRSEQLLTEHEYTHEDHQLIRELCGLGTSECAKISAEECSAIAISSLNKCINNNSENSNERSKCVYNKFGEKMEAEISGFTDCKLKYLRNLTKDLE